MAQKFEEKLVQEIESAFAEVEYPGDDRLILPFKRADYWKILNSFKGKHWKEISPEALIKHNFDLPLFTPEGFRFYLPAYLIAGLRDEPVGDFLEPAFYSLVPPDTKGPEIDDFLNKMMGFNARQRSAIKQFVKWFVETDSLDPGSLNGRTRKFWESYPE